MEGGCWLAGLCVFEVDSVVESVLCAHLASLEVGCGRGHCWQNDFGSEMSTLLC